MPWKTQRVAGFNPGPGVQLRGAVLAQWGRAESGFHPPGTPPGTIERVTDTGRYYRR